MSVRSTLLLVLIALPATLAAVRLCAADEETPSRCGGQVAESLQVEGRTVGEWRDVMKSLELSSPAAAKAVPGLMALCRDSRVPGQTRAQAAYTLGRIGEPADEAIPLLTRLLNDSGEVHADETSRWAAKALALFGPLAASASPSLVHLATSDQRPLTVREAATETLGRIGGAHPEAIPTLMQLAAADERSPLDEFEQNHLRAAAIDSLAMIGPPAGAAVPLLIRCTRDDSGDLRQHAAAAIGGMGVSGSVATEALVDLLLFDEVRLVREAATTALAGIGESGETALRQLLDDEDLAVRRGVAAALTEIERLSPATTSRLVTALEDRDADVRLSAVESLQQANHDRLVLVPVLLESLTDESRQTRIRSYRLLVSMRSLASDIIPQLQPLLKDERPYVRRAAKKAIDALNEPGEGANDGSP